MTVTQRPLATRIARRQVLSRAAAGALLGAGALANRPGAALARDATPAPNQPDNLDAVRGRVQMMHPEKLYFYLPGFQNEDFVAGIYGLDVETYRAIRAEFAAAARGAAEELLAGDEFASLVDRLPFQPGELVMAVGASSTDDLQSWFEILRHLIDLRRPNDGIRFLNQAISGQTTGDAATQVLQGLAQEPDWILAWVGANDAGRAGLGATKTNVGLEETAHNLTNLRSLAAAQSDAGVGLAYALVGG